MNLLRFKAEVESTNLATLEYDSTFSLLIVTFKNGARYGYPEISPELALGLLTAKSHGSFFNVNIRERPNKRLNS